MTSPLIRSVTIANARGLHARAAAKFTKEAAIFNADVTVSHKDMLVPAHSLMGLLMLGAAKGAVIQLFATGAQAAAAIDALCALVERKFDEE